MSLANKVVELNNAAVSYLQTGNYRAAVHNLETALEGIENYFFWSHHLKSSKFPFNNTEDEGNLRVVSLPLAPAPTLTQDTYCNVFEFYRRAFQIVSHPWEHDKFHPMNQIIVLKYNQAVAYHDDALRRNRMAHFTKALQIYDEILRIMQDYDMQAHLLLLLAIANNVGHIHSHLLNFQQTREALFWVQQLGMTARQNSCRTPNDFSFFYRTVQIFPGNDLTIAPAA